MKTRKIRTSRPIPKTIKIIGRAIKEGWQYPPLLLHARSIAAKYPHDYESQIKAIYEDIIKHWGYTRDPENMECCTISPPEIARYTLGLPRGTGRRGAGDCDDIAIAAGILYTAVGFPVRLVTSKHISQKHWSHVFIQVKNIDGQWITIDPVLFPAQKAGDTIGDSKFQIWTLEGKPL